MIQFNAKAMYIKDADGNWIPVATTGIVIDSAINTDSDNAVSNSAVAKALDKKIDRTNIATNSEIDKLFETEVVNT